MVAMEERTPEEVVVALGLVAPEEARVERQRKTVLLVEGMD